MNEQTVSQIVCEARKIDPPQGTIKGTCIYCQRPTEHGHRHKDDESSTSTYHMIRGGTCYCPYCAHMKGERWLYRSNMWVASPAGFRTFKFIEARDILMDPPEPPFALFSTRTWKKNGWLNMINEVAVSRERFPVALDYDIIQVTASQRDRMMGLAESLLSQGVTKGELEAGELRAKSIIRLGIDSLRTSVELRQLSSNPLWGLVVYLSHGPQKERDNEPKESKQEVLE